MKAHWENIYENKGDKEVSWYQDVPETSLNFIAEFISDKTDNIIDVGAGNSNLIISLLNQGFSSLTALDVSGNALKRTKNKIGPKASHINWVESNILTYKPQHKFALWHDRAVFHFLTKQKDIKEYINLLTENLEKSGYFILSTFSENGPLKCSGLAISRYNKEDLIELFGENFKLLACHTENHTTPFETEQNFIYAVFQKK